MPYVNIKLTGDSEAPTSEQKEQLIAGVTKLIADVLGKDTTHLVVVIDEVPMANYGINGKTVKALRAAKAKSCVSCQMKRATELSRSPA